MLELGFSPFWQGVFFASVGFIAARFVKEMWDKAVEREAKKIAKEVLKRHGIN